MTKCKPALVEFVLGLFFTCFFALPCFYVLFRSTRDLRLKVSGDHKWGIAMCATAECLGVMRFIFIAAALTQGFRRAEKRQVRIFAVAAAFCSIGLVILATRLFVGRLHNTFQGTIYNLSSKQLTAYKCAVWLPFILAVAVASVYFVDFNGGHTVLVTCVTLIGLSFAGNYTVLCYQFSWRLCALVQRRHASELTELKDKSSTNTDGNAAKDFDKCEIAGKDKEEEEDSIGKSTGTGKYKKRDEYKDKESEKCKDDKVKITHSKTASVLSVARWRSCSLSSFESFDRALLKVATKQCVLCVAFTLCFVCAALGVAVRVGDDDIACGGAHVTVGTILTGVGILGCCLCLYLSFVQADSEYQRICGRCNHCCQKAAALYMTLRFERAQSQQTQSTDLDSGKIISV